MSARRQFLHRVGATLATIALPRLLLAADRDAGGSRLRPISADPELDAPFTLPLRRPGKGGMFAQVALDKPLTLRATVESQAVFRGPVSRIWGYVAEIDGERVINPLLLAHSGDRVDVTLDNQLGTDTTIHWHGLSTDEANDGSGLHPVAHTQRYRYRFTVNNRGGFYWYHAHPHFHTGEQVHQGLAGPLLVRDAEENALREHLGLVWGEQDLPLVISDKQIGRKNAIQYKAGADDWIGNRTLINWTPDPYVEVAADFLRLRLANHCNARLLRIALQQDQRRLPFVLLGTDGGLLAQAYDVKRVFLAPAQRIDVLLDLRKLRSGSRLRLISDAYHPHENDAGVGEDPMLEHPGATPMGERLDLLELRVGERRSHGKAAPANLSSLPPTPKNASADRHFRLHLTEQGRWMINEWNQHLNGHKPVFRVRRGSREVWEMRNDMRSMPHPMHVHGFQFRVLARINSPRQLRREAIGANGLSAQDHGLLDTVVVWPGESVRVSIDFSQPYTGSQVYMLHCHNLEHEDQGMMVSFSVDD